MLKKTAILALAMACAALPALAGGPVAVRVHHLDFPGDPPPLSDAEIGRALAIAANLIRAGGAGECVFSSADRRPAAREVAARRGDAELVMRITDRYQIGKDTDPGRFLPHIRAGALSLSGNNLENIRSFFPDEPDRRAAIRDFASAANVLLAAYEERLAMLMKPAPGAAPLVSPDGEANSYMFWNSSFVAGGAKPEIDLWLANLLLVDDGLGDAPPHALVRGGILNGFAEETTNDVLIAYAPFLSDHPLLERLRDGRLDREERIRFLAIIIGHEVGTHLLLNFNDNYDHERCLARPVRGLRYRECLARTADLAPCPQPHRPLPDTRGHAAYRRLYLLREQGRDRDAEELIRQALSWPLPPDLRPVFLSTGVKTAKALGDAKTSAARKQELDALESVAPR